LNSEKERKKKFFSFSYSDVSLENYVTRDGRKAIDNVDDEAERELKKVIYSILYINIRLVSQTRK
jgi:DNA polymerase elongation subunit (family B)